MARHLFTDIFVVNEWEGDKSGGEIKVMAGEKVLCSIVMFQTSERNSEMLSDLSPVFFDLLST